MRGAYVEEDPIGKAERLLGPTSWTQDTVWTQRILPGYPQAHQVAFGPLACRDCEVLEVSVRSFDDQWATERDREVAAERHPWSRVGLIGR